MATYHYFYGYPGPYSLNPHSFDVKFSGLRFFKLGGTHLPSATNARRRPRLAPCAEPRRLATVGLQLPASCLPIGANPDDQATEAQPVEALSNGKRGHLPQQNLPPASLHLLWHAWLSRREPCARGLILALLLLHWAEMLHHLCAVVDDTENHTTSTARTAVCFLTFVLSVVSSFFVL
jgi:hypothetical protein